jgi:glutamate synthase (NADPH/NADH) small chain
MGKTTGFIEWQRLVAPRRPIAERLRDWREVEGHDDDELARQQAGRCMDCGVPFCMQGCPLGNPIPDFNDRVYRGRWQDAWKRLAATNNFPEFTGRLCPAPCEASCVLAIDDAAVTIEHIEKDIAERAWDEGWVLPEPARASTGARVAVVGSGPAGLAAAQQLARAGHSVVVYEADDRPGGLLRYGIPDFKMEKSVIDRRLGQLSAEGVTFRCGVRVGVDPTWDTLKAEHDAVIIAIGARVGRDLEVPGRQLDGVVMAMDFLEQQNRVVAGDLAAARWDVRGKQVIILGGGDTGSDCLGTSLRQGAAGVHQIEIMPAPPEMRAEDNPWPAWPMVFRTSSSQEEGGARDFALRTVRLEDDGHGKLAALVAERLAARGGANGARPRSPGDLVATGDEVRLPCDQLILAMGFTGPDTRALTEQLGVSLDRRGNVVAAAPGWATSVPGVFACGDARRGQSLIVWAIAEGRETARAVDTWLRGGPSWLPARGVDQPFDGPR